MIITNSTPDTYYFNQLIAFLMSIKINSPKHISQVKVFLANFPCDLENRLKKAFVEVTFENNSLEMIDERGFSLIIDRTFRVFDCLKKFKDQVLWLDTDIIVRGDLSELIEIQPKQLKILYRKGASEESRINAGVFNIGYSQESCDFIDDWHQRVISNAEWGKGQLELWRSFKRHRDNIELVDITKKYNSVGRHFYPDFVIWHCKMKHFKEPKYQKEYKVYLKKAKKLLKS